MTSIEMPFDKEKINKLICGDLVSLSGTIYTARDVAHKRIIECINNNQSLPFDLKDQAIYYVGPTPSRPGQVIGSAGPTTSYRMDDLTIPLLEQGLKIMIGKGKRDEKIIEAIKNYNAVYLAAVGGAGAYISNSIKSCEIVAYEDLDSEAIRKLEVENLQLIVAIDSYGNNIYEKGREEYAK